jgi:hypothetical protein
VLLLLPLVGVSLDWYIGPRRNVSPRLDGT